jgi:hypothetical protein
MGALSLYWIVMLVTMWVSESIEILEIEQISSDSEKHTQERMMQE